MQEVLDCDFIHADTTSVALKAEVEPKPKPNAKMIDINIMIAWPMEMEWALNLIYASLNNGYSKPLKRFF